MNALDVVTLVQQLLVRLLRGDDQHVKDFDDQIFGCGRKDRGLEIGLLVILAHACRYAPEPDELLVVEKPNTDANSCCSA